MYHWHIGILTKDIDESIKAVSALPGVNLDKWLFGEVDFSDGRTYVGTSGKLRTASGRIGTVVYEFLQPLDDVSFHAAELAEKGPGVHHTAYVCEGDGELEKTVESCLKAGASKVWDVEYEGERVIYVETADKSMMFEFINCCPFMPKE